MNLQQYRDSTHILKADDVLKAYEKIHYHYKTIKEKELTKLNGKKGRWVFEGVIDLVPIYEEFEDLSEILWNEHKNIAVKTIKKELLSIADIKSNYSE
jgi:hypothetical protein